MTGQARYRMEDGTGGRSLRALKASALFTLAAAAATAAVYALAHWPFGLPELAVPLFLGTVASILLAWQEGALETDPRGFMHRFMLGLAMKLLASLAAVALILFLLPRRHGVRLALTFAVLYLVFLAFTTVRLSARPRNRP